MNSLNKVQPIDSSDGTINDDMVHVVCTNCYPENDPEAKALCGTELTGQVLPEDSEAECVVCAELQDLQCERCGV